METTTLLLHNIIVIGYYDIYANYFLTALSIDHSLVLKREQMSLCFDLVTLSLDRAWRLARYYHKTIAKNYFNIDGVCHMEIAVW